MLSEICQADFLYEVPKFELGRKDVLDFAKELEDFHENFTDCFHRSEPREKFFLIQMCCSVPWITLLSTLMICEPCLVL
jgi:hypothetical protein